MTSRLVTLQLLWLAILSSACAHANGDAPDRHPVEAVYWPAPPASPRARLVAVLPDGEPRPPPRPFWRRALEWLAGTARSEENLPTGALVRPFGVAANPKGEVFVVDPDLARVTRYDGAARASLIECKGAPWSAPMAVALAPDGALLVADGGAARIVRWTPEGCKTLGQGLFERPTGVAATAERVWVVDPPRHQVIALSNAGDELLRRGELGDGEGQFHFPTSLALAPDGTLLVVDALNFRVVRLDPDGRWLGAFGAAGDSEGAFARPKGIATDAAGRIFVSDAQRGVVLVFDPGGAFGFAVGQNGSDSGQLALPAGLFVRGERLLVADSQNHRIQEFELLGGSP